MIYGIFSDIHSNYEALTTVLKDMLQQGVTHPICLGDIVGYNPNPAECLELVRTLKCPTVLGNHDEIVSGKKSAEHFNEMASEAIQYSCDNVSPDGKAYLASLPFHQKIEDFTIVHASMDEPENWNYINSALEASSSFIYQRTPVCFCGHTHVAKIFIKEKKATEQKPDPEMKLKRTNRYLINVGSVGQPRDGDWRASYAVYDSEKKILKIRRLEYPVETTQKKIRDAGLSERLAERLITAC